MSVHIVRIFTCEETLQEYTTALISGKNLGRTFSYVFGKVLYNNKMLSTITSLICPPEEIKQFFLLLLVSLGHGHGRWKSLSPQIY